MRTGCDGGKADAASARGGRTIRRSLSRTELWSGNREHLGTLRGRDELLRFLWRESPKYRRRYSTIADDSQWVHLTVIHLVSPRDVRRWLATVR